MSIVGKTDDTETRSLDSRLAEIDENLIRGELSAAERAMLTAERKAVYEAIHPETVASTPQGGGRRRRNGSQVETQTAETFVDDTAKKSGRSRPSVARDATRGKKLKDDLPKVVGTSLDKGVELDARGLAARAVGAPEGLDPAAHRFALDGAPRAP